MTFNETAVEKKSYGPMAHSVRNQIGLITR